MFAFILMFLIFLIDVVIVFVFKSAAYELPFFISVVCVALNCEVSEITTLPTFLTMTMALELGNLKSTDS